MNIKHFVTKAALNHAGKFIARDYWDTAFVTYEYHIPDAENVLLDLGYSYIVINGYNTIKHALVPPEILSQIEMFAIVKSRSNFKVPAYTVIVDIHNHNILNTLTKDYLI